MTDRPTLPAERMYWTILEGTGWKRSGVLPAEFLTLFEEEAPIDVTNIHAVCVPLADGGLAVCGVERREMEAVSASELSLTPAGLPSFLHGRAAASEFNLLVGAFEPSSIRIARARRHLVAAAVVLGCASMIALGLERRTSRWEAIGRSALVGTEVLMDGVFENDDGSRSAVARLDDELDRLGRVRLAFAEGNLPRDAGAPLGALLRAWPTGVPSTPNTIAVAPSGVTVSVSVEGDAAPFLRAFHAPEGWSLDEPRLSAADAVTRLTLHMRPSTEEQR